MKLIVVTSSLLVAFSTVCGLHVAGQDLQRREVGSLYDDMGPLNEPCAVDFYPDRIHLSYLNGTSVIMYGDDKFLATALADVQSDSDQDFFPIGFTQREIVLIWVYPELDNAGTEIGRTFATGVVALGFEPWEYNFSFRGTTLLQYEYRHYALGINPSPTKYFFETKRHAPRTSRPNPWGYTESYLFVRCIFEAPVS